MLQFWQVSFSSFCDDDDDDDDDDDELLCGMADRRKFVNPYFLPGYCWRFSC